MMLVVSCMYQPGKAVWLENSPVGTGHTSQPAAESTGIATPSEHFPYPHRSWTAATRGM